jgi:vancomycin resistance protein YoaR
MLLLLNLFDKRGVSSISIILIFLALLLIGASSYAVILFGDLLDQNVIYKGITVNDRDVSGLTKEELKQWLVESEKNVLEQKSITVSYNDKTREIRFTDVDIDVNIDEIVEAVWSIGRVGTKKERVFEILSVYLRPKKFYTNVTYDPLAVEKIITEIYDDIFVERIDNSYEITEGEILLKSGTDGKELKRVQLADQVYEALDRLESARFQAEVSVYPRKNVNAEEIFQKVYVQEEPATFKVEDNQVIIIPEKQGKTVDKKILEESVDQLGKKEKITIPLSIQTVIPDVRYDDVKEKIFRDVLDRRTTVYSEYDTNTKNRGHNIRLVAQYVNGKVLAPGEVFSFNDVVGERSPERGFKPANVYTSGRIETDYGGGICQISSLLYNSALYSGLEIVERLNHQFTVSYVDLGTDATVSWGSVDFKFRNNTNYPLKIECYLQDQAVEIVFRGTDEHPGRVVTVETKIEQVYPFSVIEEIVPTLQPGQTVIKQSGMTGYYVTAKRIFKEGDKVEVEQLRPSWYSKLDQIVQKGAERVSTESTEAA